MEPKNQPGETHPAERKHGKGWAPSRGLPANPNVVHLIPIAEIECSWFPVRCKHGLTGGNIRTGCFDQDPRSPNCGELVGPEDDPDMPLTDHTAETSFTEIKASMARAGDIATGQKVPVIVRPHPDPSSDKLYMLVDGFQREAAARQLQMGWGVAIPVLRCVIEEMDDQAALERQVLENSKTPVSSADLVFAVKRFRDVAPQMQQVEIAHRIGKPPSFVSYALKILNGTQHPDGEKILEHWRRLRVRVSPASMLEIAERPPEEQEKAWNALVRGRCEKCGAPILGLQRKHKCGSVPTGRKAWVARGIATGKSGGLMLGRLVREGIIVIKDEEKLFSLEMLSCLIDLGEESRAAAMSIEDRTAWIKRCETIKSRFEKSYRAASMGARRPRSRR